MRFARSYIHNYKTARLDEEDIVVSVFESVWKGAELGRFDSVKNVDEMLWLLLAMTTRKAVDHIRRETAVKRIPNGQFPKSIDSVEALRMVVAASESPDYFVILNDQLRHILEKFPDESHRQIAVLRIAGHNDSEIMIELDCSASTVGRKRGLIRKICRQEMGND